MTSGNRGRDRATQADPAAWTALRADLATSRGLPVAWRDVLLDEAADLIDAGRRHQAVLRPHGVLTRRGVVRAAYRDYLALQPRLERVLRLLGLLDGAEPSRPSVEELLAAARRPSVEETCSTS